MKVLIYLTGFALLMLSYAASNSLADGNVTTFVESGGTTLYIVGDNQDNEIRISTLYGGELLLVEGLDGTTINENWNEFDHPGFQYTDIVVDLMNGEDVLVVTNYTTETDGFDIYQGEGDARITIEQSKLANLKVITGTGKDIVEMQKVEGRHVRISDAEGAFPANVALPETSSSLFISDTLISCLDLQARKVEVDNHKGALIVAATEADIEKVDSTTGNAQLGVWGPFADSVSPSSVVVAAEYDSPESSVWVSDVQTSDMSVLYYDTVFNERTQSLDSITVEHVTADYLTVATGLATDNVSLRRIEVEQDLILDMGSGTDRRNLDGTNFALLNEVVVGDDCEIFGGSGKDRVLVHSLSVEDSLFVDLQFGSDELTLYYASIANDCDVEFGSGSDNLKSYKSGLGELSVHGGFGFDRAIQVGSNWESVDMNQVESHNF